MIQQGKIPVVLTSVAPITLERRVYCKTKTNTSNVIRPTHNFTVRPTLTPTPQSAAGSPEGGYTEAELIDVRGFAGTCMIDEHRVSGQIAKEEGDYVASGDTLKRPIVGCTYA